MEPLEDVAMTEADIDIPVYDEPAYVKVTPRPQPKSMQERVTDLIREATVNLAKEKEQLASFQTAAVDCCKNIIKYEIQLNALVAFTTAAKIAEEHYEKTMNQKPNVPDSPARRIDMEE